MPSRANLLTGRYPHAIESMRMEGEYPGSTYDPDKCPFWPRVFRANGYQTAQIGKWHTGTDTGYGRDWDFQIVWNRPKNPKNAGVYYGDQIIERNGNEQTVERLCDRQLHAVGLRLHQRGNGRDKAKPWFLWLCYGAIHGPSTPAPRHLGKYKDEPVEPPVDILPPRPEKPEYLNRSQAWHRGRQRRNHAPARRPQNSATKGRAGKTYAQWVRQVNECALGARRRHRPRDGRRCAKAANSKTRSSCSPPIKALRWASTASGTSSVRTRPTSIRR